MADLLRTLQRYLPQAVCGLLVFVLLSFYLPQLGVGLLADYDEYYTYERTQGIVDRGDLWTLYSNNLPTFRKPPLQYWAGAGLLQLGVGPSFALRLPSFVAAIGTLILTGVLAGLLSDRRGVAAALAMLALSASGLFWESGLTAMLDSGAAFFALAAVVCAILTLRDARYWWVLALVIGLGALQKAPIGLALVVAALPFLRLQSGGRHIAGAAILVVLLVASWPALQIALHGQGYLRSAIVNEMVARFQPVADGTGGRLAQWVGWLWDDLGPLWPIALLATLALPTGARRREGFIVVASCALILLAMTLAGGRLFERYLVILLPLIAAGLGAMAARLPMPVGVLAAAVGLWLWGSAAFRPVGEEAPAFVDQLPLMQGFRAAVGPDDTLLFCVWDREDRIIHPGALTVYASAGKPFFNIWYPDSLAADIEGGVIEPPYRGLCSDAAFGQFTALYFGADVQQADAGWVHWRSDGLTPRQ